MKRGFTKIRHCEEASLTKQSRTGLPRSRCSLAMTGHDGFTLVELSIVLVIVGLLIGGILVGRSMISTARITAQVQQLAQFNAGVETFKTKYGYLPGDAPQFGGDGNGVLSSVTFPNNDSFTGEIANFFPQWDSILFPGYSPYGTHSTPPITTGSGKNVPASKIGSSGAFFIVDSMSTSVGNQADLVNPSSYYIILTSDQAQTSGCAGINQFRETTATNSAVAPSDLLALDKKMDDGIANSGNVISGRMYGGTSGGCGTPRTGGPNNSPVAGLCSSGATYYATHPGYECTPLIRIGGQIGDLQ